MKDLVVLANGDIVYLSSISEDEIFDPLNNDLLFFNNGRVRRFKKNGIAYMAIFDENTNKFDSYRSEINFWNHNKPNKSRTDTTTTYEALGHRFLIWDVLPGNAKKGDNVILAHKKITVNGDKLETNILYRSIPYEKAHPLRAQISLNSNHPNFSEYKISEIATQEVIERLVPYYNFIINKQFLAVNNQLRDLTGYEHDILIDIIQVFDWIFTQNGFLNHLSTLKLIEPFNQVINLSTRYNQDYGVIDPKYHLLYNDEYFARLRLGLIEFKYWLIQYSDDYTKINANDLVVYIVNLFDPVELSYLSYETKINLLDKILRDNFWIIGNWGFNKLNDEEAILKIIKCIAKELPLENLNYSEIDKFMDLLNKIFDYNKKLTLYEVLYDRINDTTFFNDDGRGNKGRLVKAIYNLWTESKFNPQHSKTEIAQNALNYFNYTSYNCRWQFDSDDPSIIFPILDEDAAPMLINYESEKILLWYKDNFNFSFYDNKILAQEKIKDYGYQPFGVYNIFQPIALKITNADDTIIRMPAKGITEGASITDFIDNCFPVFYLQYLDDLGDKSDTKETISTIVDVVLTFSGVGNIAKLRHIKDLSLLRKFLIAGELSAIESVALARAWSGLTSGFQAIMGVASFVHRYTTASCTIYYDNEQNPPNINDPQYQKYQLCRSIEMWLFALEILSLSGDLLARRAFKRATKRLQQSIPPDNEYNELRTAVNSLDEIDSMFLEWLNSIHISHPNVYNKLITFTDQEKKFAFMFDFQGRPSALDELEAAPHLIEEAWLEIAHLITHRNNVKFLKSFHFIDKDIRCERLREHLFQGHTYPSGNVGGWHHIEGNVNSNNFGRIDNIIDASDSRGYFTANVSIKDTNGNWIPKRDGGGNLINNDMFPRNWSRQELIENISVAYTNKVFNGTGNQYRGLMSDGKTVIICINGNANVIDQTTNIKTLWPRR
ncbi:EndoU domain-containing protein [Flavobacterium ginsenosidimutans]|uniref:EndoU domain-containing protein n=1 Tax=Flavobacterium ginsenosidimutans TaxID=687844 RepID=A0ABZ2QD44_9FLAO